MRYERQVFDRYLTEAEERQLLRYVRQFADPLAQRDHAWMRLGRYTGVRVGVLSGLTVADAREALRTGTLMVRGAINKGGRGYSVALVKKARVAVQDLLRVRRAMGRAEVPGEPLIINRRGGQLSVRSFQARMRKWVQAAGLSVAASPHWWRHTCAKRVMKRSTAGDPRGVVQAALGQASVESTAVYTTPDREDVAQALEEAS